MLDYKIATGMRLLLWMVSSTHPYLKDLIKEWYDGFDIVLAKRIKRKENLRKFYIGVFLNYKATL